MILNSESKKGDKIMEKARNMEKHLTLVGALSITLGILGVFFAIVALIAIVGAGLLSDDPTARFVTQIVGPAVALFLALTSLPGIIGGIGLLKRKTWARILVLIYAVPSLLSIPFGTAFGVYAIWVFMQDETTSLLVTGHGAKETSKILEKVA